jgi:hypothetical protein
MMMRSGGSGLLGYGDRSTANAFEAKIDNKLTAMITELFAFMPKRVGRGQLFSTTRPWDFPVLPKTGL